jgi:hypothetical protein
MILKIVFKLLALFSMALYCSSSFALELKLKCNITTKRTSYSGNVEKNNSMATVEVQDYGLKKYIFITSSDEYANDLSVQSTSKNENNIIRTGNDFSDSGKWDVSTVTVNNVGLQTRSERRIFIDRNTGDIIAQSTFNYANMNTIISISGSCDKIDQVNKKF